MELMQLLFADQRQGLCGIAVSDMKHSRAPIGVQAFEKNIAALKYQKLLLPHHGRHCQLLLDWESRSDGRAIWVPPKLFVKGVINLCNIMVLPVRLLYTH